MGEAYYRDKNGNIKIDLLDKKAFEFAESFIKPKEGKPLTSAQLRRFFGEFRQLEKKVKKEDNEDNFDKIKPLVKMVKSKASYAANPKNQKIPDTFKKFLIDNVEQINFKQDFEDFMLHFEAVVGFCYGLGMKTD